MAFLFNPTRCDARHPLVSASFQFSWNLNFYMHTITYCASHCCNITLLTAISISSICHAHAKQSSLKIRSTFYAAITLCCHPFLSAFTAQIHKHDFNLQAFYIYQNVTIKKMILCTLVFIMQMQWIKMLKTTLHCTKPVEWIKLK